MRLLRARLPSFFMPYYDNRGLITEIHAAVHSAAPRCKQEVCTAEYSVGTGRRTTSVIHGILLGTGKGEKLSLVQAGRHHLKKHAKQVDTESKHGTLAQV